MTQEERSREIFRAMEGDILALVAVDPAADEYEVIYTDGTIREFGTPYRNKDFFGAWKRSGLPLSFTNNAGGSP